MTIAEKLQLIEAHPDQVFFFREGCFYKCYNQNLYWFCKELKPLRVLSRYVKKEKRTIVYGGFPVTAMASLRQKHPVLEKIRETSYGFLLQYAIDLQEYPVWFREQLPKGRDGPMEKAPARAGREMATLIREFPLEQKTPMEAFLFLKEIREMEGL